MYLLDRLEIHAVDHCNLACVGCNHNSPFLKKREYTAEDYIPWIERIKAKDVRINKLCITGGEAFLHRDLCPFVGKLKEAAEPGLTEIFSNCYWLTDEQSIDKHDCLLRTVNRLHYSLYKPIVDKIGLDEMNRLLGIIKDRYPNLHVTTFVDGINKTFGLVAFYDEPVERLAHQTCQVKTCTQLRADGKLYRCPQGLALEGHPGMSEGFKASQDIVYDLAGDDDRDFHQFLAKWPLDACAYCSCGLARETPIPWTSDPKIRGMGPEEYKNRLVQIVFRGV